MNTTLAQLAHKAGITVTAESEKFARLIVQECTEVTADWYKNHNQYHMPPDEHIKAHFGAES
jgi:hypothetical protein